MKQLKKFFNIPNILCLIRIGLIPVLLFLYIKKQNHLLSFVLLCIMELTDLFDGYIARKYNLITNVGKILDPFADKLLQLVLAFLLISNYKFAIILLITFIFKEIICAIFSIYTCMIIKKIDGARIWGKVSTTVFYVVSVMLLFLPNISMQFANCLIIISTSLLAYACIRYIIYYIKQIKNARNNN